MMKFIFNFKSFNKLTDINTDKLDSEKPSIVQRSALWQRRKMSTAVLI